MPPRPRSLPRPVYAGVFALAGSIILFQIALTRVFAIMMWHHLTYMVVSIALLGFGAAGSLLTARRDSLREDSPHPALSTSSALYGAFVLVAYALVIHFPINSIELWRDKTNLLALLAIYGLVAVPFLLGGIALGTALTRLVHDVNRLYFVDLVGSAVGGAISVWLLAQLGSTATVGVAATLGMVAAWFFGLSASRRHAAVAAVGVLATSLVTVALSNAGPALGLPRLALDPPFAPGKELVEYDPDSLDRIFSATAEVEVGPSERTTPKAGGEFGFQYRELVNARLVGQDGTAPTLLFEDAADLESFPFLRDTQSATAYVAREASGRTDPEVLVIGVGGGIDVMVALARGAEKVTAVEINTAMIEMATERYDDYLGGLFRPGAHPWSDKIELVNGEGRAFMRSQDRKYDLIQMSGVDSFTALSTGAYTLSETYLYTVEAVQEFYEHLEDGGFINYSRFILTHPKKPRETLRLAHIARTALAELGVEEPAAQIAVFQGELWASTIIKRGAFTRAEVDALDAFARRNRFVGFIFDPLRDPDAPFESTAQPFAHTRKMQQLFQHQVAKFLRGADFATAQAALFDVLAAIAHRHDGNEEAERASLAAFASRVAEPLRPAATAWAADVVAGTQPLMSELADHLARTRRDYRTLLRGDADQRQAFLDDYEYDVSACTDDRPFFFNYYRWGQVFESRELKDEAGLAERYHPDVPVGQMVLLASLVQIGAFGVALIFWPLRRLARAGLSTRGAPRYFAYFAALGAGFMFVEIVLMQKLVIFLGHPTYAVSVVLTSLLGFAGIGSFLAQRIRSLERANLLRLGAAVTVLVLLSAVIVNVVLPQLLGFPLGVRIVSCVLAVMPVGVALGMPFPTGLRVVEREAPQLLPWCWAINGFLSVFSSVLCIVFSMFFGFTAMLVGAAVVYALGFSLLPGVRDAAPGAAAEA